MKPARYDLKLYRGDTYTWRFTFWSDDDHTVPADLTTVEIAAEIRDRSAGAKVTALTCTLNPPNVVDVNLAADDCGFLPVKGGWDLQLIYPGDIVRTVVAGSVQVTADITQSTRVLLPA